MNVGSLCDRNIVCVSRTTTVADVAASMRRHRTGELFVIDDSEHCAPVGIVTERDIVFEVVALGADPKALTVAQLLRAPLLSVDTSDSCEDVARLMMLHGARHMAVVGDAGRLAGIVTLEELLACFSAPLAQLSHLAAHVRRTPMDAPL